MTARPGPAAARLRRWRASAEAHPAAADALTAGFLATALLPQTLVTLFSLELHPGWTVPVLAALGVLHVTPALRRTAPVTGFAVACLAMLVVVLAPDGVLARPPRPVLGFPMLFLPSTLVFLFALNAVAVHARRRVSVLAVVASTAGVALGVVRGSQRVPEGYPALQYRSYLALALTIAVLFAWGLGTARAVRVRFEAAERAEAARAAMLAERSRIARDMHDVVAHSLAVIVRLAEAGALLTTRSPDRAREMLTTIADTGRDALGDMRGMLGVLRASDPADDGAPGGDPGEPPAIGPQPGLADLSEMIERIRVTGVDVTVRESGTPVPLGGVAELAAYHVVREALTNTVKHAGPGSRAEVALDWRPDGLTLRVEDDGGPGRRDGAGSGAGAEAGAGAGPASPVPPVPGSGSGLAGLRQRVEAVGGSLRSRRLAPGFVVRAEVPGRTGRRREDRGRGERT